MKFSKSFSVFFLSTLCLVSSGWALDAFDEDQHCQWLGKDASVTFDYIVEPNVPFASPVQLPSYRFTGARITFDKQLGRITINRGSFNGNSAKTIALDYNRTIDDNTLTQVDQFLTEFEQARRPAEVDQAKKIWNAIQCARALLNL